MLDKILLTIVVITVISLIISLIKTYKIIIDNNLHNLDTDYSVDLISENINPVPVKNNTSSIHVNKLNI